MIYLNYNSTSPLCDAAREEMASFLKGTIGNPSEVLLAEGRDAKNAIEAAREEVAQLLGAKSSEVVFTSGGSEACFLALGGIVATGVKRIILSGIEHPAVSEAAKWLESVAGATVEIIPISAEAGIDWRLLEATLGVGTPGILSFMFANNETGDLLPLREIASKAKRFGWLVHSDCVQAVGKKEINFSESGMDLVSISSHKIGGPRGVGAVVIRQGVEFKSPLVAGGQQQGRRGGTEPVAEIVGFGVAARLARKSIGSGEPERIRNLRDNFEQKVLQKVAGAKINRTVNFERLCNTTNIYLPGIVSFELVERLAKRGVTISAGSACASSQLKPSKTLLALGLSTLTALSSVRISFGGDLTEASSELAAQILVEEAKAMRDEMDSDLEKRVANV